MIHIIRGGCLIRARVLSWLIQPSRKQLHAFIDVIEQVASMRAVLRAKLSALEKIVECFVLRIAEFVFDSSRPPFARVVFPPLAGHEEAIVAALINSDPENKSSGRIFVRRAEHLQGCLPVLLPLEVVLDHSKASKSTRQSVHDVILSFG
jgi:hypothetical protein